MDCSEAQALLRAGTIPGGGPGREPRLGFHLAGCAACRTLRVCAPAPASTGARVVKTTLVAGLRSRRFYARRFRPALLIAVIMLSIPGWYVGLPLARAWRNLGRMTSVAAEAGDVQSVNNVLPTEIVGAAASIPTSTRDDPVIATVVKPSVTREATPIILPSVTATRSLAMKPTQRIGAEVVDPPTPTATPLPTATALPTATEPPTETPAPLPTALPPTETPAPLPTAPPPSPTTAPAIVAAAPPVAVPPLPPPNMTSPGGVTILVMGLDARPGETVSRSDAIMVVRVDPARQRFAMLSLPRDLWVAIPNYGEGKINSAYVLGQQSGKGAAVAAATVANALGIRIDYTATVDFQGFGALVDALGGVPVDVPRELYDAKFPTIDYGYTVAHFVPGTERMNGPRALMYSRIRHPDSDFQRMRRQQAVALGMIRQFRERGALANMHEADQLTAALAPFVRTSMPRGEALRLMWELRGVDMNTARRIVVDTTIVGEATIGGSYALVADAGALRAVGAQLTAP